MIGNKQVSQVNQEKPTGRITGNEMDLGVGSFLNGALFTND